MYIESEKKKKRHSVLVKHLPKVKFKIPNIFSQFLIFVKRDVLAKLSNKQYVSVNFLESPLIAVILSFIIKYYNLSDPNGYTLSGNGNLPIYLFIATIVAVIVTFIIYYIMTMKQKSNKLYLFVFMYYLVLNYMLSKI